MTLVESAERAVEVARANPGTVALAAPDLTWYGVTRRLSEVIVAIVQDRAIVLCYVVPVEDDEQR